MNPCTLVLCSVACVNLAFVRRVHEVTLGSRIDSICHCRVEKSLQSYMSAAAIPPQCLWNQRSQCAASATSSAKASNISTKTFLSPRDVQKLRKLKESQEEVSPVWKFFNDTKGLLSQLTMMDEGSFPFLTRVFKLLLPCRRKQPNPCI